MPLQQIPCTYLCAKTPSLLGDLGAYLLTSFHAESSSFAFMKKNDEGRMRMWSPLHTLKESSREREMEGEGGQSYLKHSYYLVLYPHDARCILYDIFSVTKLAWCFRFAYQLLELCLLRESQHSRCPYLLCVSAYI